MFSLLITIVSIALVAALALATLYYGGRAYTQSAARAQAARVDAQAQQLLGAAELFYANRGQWPRSPAEMVTEGYLKDVPRAGLTLENAFASEHEWDMPVERVPVFTLSTPQVDACRSINSNNYGQPGVLARLDPSLRVQCYSSDNDGLVTVVARNTAFLQEAISTSPAGTPLEGAPTGSVPTDPEDEDWAIAPGAPAGTQPPAGGGEGPDDPEDPGVLQASSASLDFGTRAPATDTTLVLTATNQGPGSVLFSGAPYVNGGSGAFVVTSNSCTASLANGASCSTSVRFTPPMDGSYSASLHLPAQAPSASLTIPLTGTAESTVAALWSRNVGYQSSASGSYLAWSSTLAGSQGALKELYLRKSSGTGLLSANFTFSGDTQHFRIEMARLVTTAGTGLEHCTSRTNSSASCDVTSPNPDREHIRLSLRYVPQSAGNHSVTLSALPGARSADLPAPIVFTGTATATEPVTDARWSSSNATASAAQSSLTFSPVAVGSVSSTNPTTYSTGAIRLIKSAAGSPTFDGAFTLTGDTQHFRILSVRLSGSGGAGRYDCDGGVPVVQDHETTKCQATSTYPTIEVKVQYAPQSAGSHSVQLQVDTESAASMPAPLIINGSTL